MSAFSSMKEEYLTIGPIIQQALLRESQMKRIMPYQVFCLSTVSRSKVLLCGCLWIFSLTAIALPEKDHDKPEKSRHSNQTTPQPDKKTKKSSPLALVPPPPPTTPSILAGPDELAGAYGPMMPIDFMSTADLKKRQKDLESELADSQKELKDKEDSHDSVKEKATQFQELYKEGVISRRELETAQKEADTFDPAINRLKRHAEDLQLTLGQIKNKLKSQESAKIRRAKSAPTRKHRSGSN